MTVPHLDRSNIVEFIADIFERRGAESDLGEPVTMSEHMLQGAVLAEREGASEELVAAALLHDILATIRRSSGLIRRNTPRTTITRNWAPRRWRRHSSRR